MPTYGNRPPDVDKEIENIRKFIRTAHLVAYQLSDVVQNATHFLNGSLQGFDSAISGVRHDASNIRNDVVEITQKFPTHTIYLGILLFIDLLIWLFAIFLFCRIIKNIRQRKSPKLKLEIIYQIDPNFPSAANSQNLKDQRSVHRSLWDRLISQFQHSDRSRIDQREIRAEEEATPFLGADQNVPDFEMEKLPPRSILKQQQYPQRSDLEQLPPPTPKLGRRTIAVPICSGESSSTSSMQNGDVNYKTFI